MILCSKYKQRPEPLSLSEARELTRDKVWKPMAELPPIVHFGNVHGINKEPPGPI